MHFIYLMLWIVYLAGFVGINIMLSLAGRDFFRWKDTGGTFLTAVLLIAVNALLLITGYVLAVELPKGL